MLTTSVIMGAGHAGLAMSRRLTERSIDHIVFERGEVANSWRTERWDSLRLLTPNRESRLPGPELRRRRPRWLHGSTAEVVGAFIDFVRCVHQRASPDPYGRHQGVGGASSTGIR